MTTSIAGTNNNGSSTWASMVAASSSSQNQRTAKVAPVTLNPQTNRVANQMANPSNDLLAFVKNLVIAKQTIDKLSKYDVPPKYSYCSKDKLPDNLKNLAPYIKNGGIPTPIAEKLTKIGEAFSSHKEFSVQFSCIEFSWGDSLDGGDSLDIGVQVQQNANFSSRENWVISEIQKAFSGCEIKRLEGCRYQWKHEENTYNLYIHPVEETDSRSSSKENKELERKSEAKRLTLNKTAEPKASGPTTSLAASAPMVASTAAIASASQTSEPTTSRAASAPMIASTAAAALTSNSETTNSKKALSGAVKRKMKKAVQAAKKEAQLLEALSPTRLASSVDVSLFPWVKTQLGLFEEIDRACEEGPDSDVLRELTLSGRRSSFSCFKMCIDIESCSAKMNSYLLDILLIRKLKQMFYLKPEKLDLFYFDSIIAITRRLLKCHEVIDSGLVDELFLNVIFCLDGRTEKSVFLFFYDHADLFVPWANGFKEICPVSEFNSIINDIIKYLYVNFDINERFKNEKDDLRWLRLLALIDCFDPVLQKCGKSLRILKDRSLLKKIREIYKELDWGDMLWTNLFDFYVEGGFFDILYVTCAQKITKEIQQAKSGVNISLIKKAHLLDLFSILDPSSLKESKLDLLAFTKISSDAFQRQVPHFIYKKTLFDGMNLDVLECFLFSGQLVEARLHFGQYLSKESEARTSPYRKCEEDTPSGLITELEIKKEMLEVILDPSIRSSQQKMAVFAKNNPKYLGYIRKYLEMLLQENCPINIAKRKLFPKENPPVASSVATSAPKPDTKQPDPLK